MWLIPEKVVSHTGKSINFLSMLVETESHDASFKLAFESDEYKEMSELFKPHSLLMSRPFYDFENDKHYAVFYVEEYLDSFDILTNIYKIKKAEKEKAEMLNVISLENRPTNKRKM